MSSQKPTTGESPHPELVSHKVAFNKVDDVRVLALSHDQNFVNNQIFLWLVVEIHSLDSHLMFEKRIKRKKKKSTLGEKKKEKEKEKKRITVSLVFLILAT